jgi:hypothetical protein
VSREDGWKKKGCSRSPAAANSAGGACRCRGGRRAIRAAGGTIWRGTKGEMERSCRAFIGAGESDKMGGH